MIDLRNHAGQIKRKVQQKQYFQRSLKRYKKLFLSTGSKLPKIELFPQLEDETDETEFDAHYIYQGPWVMQRLLKTKPRKHVDIGSWLPYLGFFSSLQPTEFVDIRPARLDIPGLKVVEGSILGLPYKDNSLSSVSCMHVLEHIGLGRYGDPLDPKGTEKAAAELQRVLVPGGSLFITLPIGKEVTYFNAHRVTAPSSVLKMFTGLKLKEFELINDQSQRVKGTEATKAASKQKYGLGLYWFTKK